MENQEGHVGTDPRPAEESGPTGVILALKKDDGELCAFEDENAFKLHADRHPAGGFRPAEWVLFDSAGGELSVSEGSLVQTGNAASIDELEARLREIIAIAHTRAIDALAADPVHPAAEDMKISDVHIFNRLARESFDQLMRSLPRLSERGDHPHDVEEPRYSGEEEEPAPGDPGPWYHYMFSPHH